MSNNAAAHGRGGLEGENAMNGTCLFLGLLFVSAGVFFYCGRAVEHIAAWRRMPEEEKARIRIRPLCRNIGSMIAASGVLFVLGGVCSSFRDGALVWCMVGWLVAAGADVCWMERSGRYQNKAQPTPRGTDERRYQTR